MPVATDHRTGSAGASTTLTFTARFPRLGGYLCAVLVAICALASFPFAEVGLDDDFSYIHTAQTLARTGHVVYVGWASAMLGWQLPLGALFIKLFGFSFSAPRAAILVVSAVTAFLLQRTFIRFGMQERNATLGTLTFCLSPLFLPLAFSFMSDMSGIFATVLCLYMCTRAVQAEENRASFAWLTLACLLNAFAGTARQTGWFGMLVMVPSAFWLIRARKPSILAALGVWVVSLALLVGSMRWFSHQTYSLAEKVVAGYIDRDLIFHAFANFGKASFDVFLFLLPVTVAFIPAFPLHNRRLLRGTAIAALLMIALAVYLAHIHQLTSWLAPFAEDGAFVSPGGLVDVPEIGRRPLVLQPWVQGIITIAALLGLIAVVAFGFNLRRRKDLLSSASLMSSSRPLTWREVLVLIGPFSLAYCAPLLHRALFNSVYDRYLLPIFPMCLIVLIRLYQEHVAARLPAICVYVLAIFTLFGVAGMHDIFAMRRARVEAANKLIDAGVPRTAFYGGFEYDGWTQIEAMGFVNSGYILMPDGFHPDKPVPRMMTVKPCDNRFAQNDPAIQPRFALSFDQVACDGPSNYQPVQYAAWLPPFTRAIYIRTVTKPAF